MEVEILPASTFNSSNECESSAKRFKSSLAFHCIVCNDVYADPNGLYDHMKTRHAELYEGNTNDSNAIEIDDLDDESTGAGDSPSDFCQRPDENNSESDIECTDVSDGEFSDLSKLLEPICELRHEGEDEEERVNRLNAAKMTEVSYENQQQLRYEVMLRLQAFDKEQIGSEQTQRSFKLRKFS